MAVIKDKAAVSLDKKEKIYLLELSRKTITCLLEAGNYPRTKPVSDKVKEKFGVFVTLRKKGQLRGCIGYLEGIKPLYEAVMDLARSAAFLDPRFTPVERGELVEIDIEISVLSSILPIKNVKEIQVGKHGILMRRGEDKGLLLPQVATEWNWNREEFLKQTCNKAGLPNNAWKDPQTEISIFSAEIFSEKDLGISNG